jgi:hypothetical protein
MRRSRGTGGLIVPATVAVLAIACCAGLPLLAGAFAGLTLAALLGVGGGLIAVLAVVAGMVLVLRGRRRRSFPPTVQRPTS